MNELLNNNLKRKLKGLGLYQIIGGGFGICLTIWLLAQTQTITGMVIILFALAFALYIFSIYSGQQLIKGNIKKGLRLSVINQILQTINFAVCGYAFEYVSGFILSGGIKYDDGLSFTGAISLSTFHFNFNGEVDSTTASINIVAIYLVYFIDKLNDEIEQRELILKQSENTENISTTGDV